MCVEMSPQGAAFFIFIDDNIILFVSVCSAWREKKK